VLLVVLELLAAGREYADVGAGGQLGLALLGGMVAPKTTTTVIPAAGRAIRETVRPFTEAGREVIAGNVLRQLSNAPETAVTRMQEFQPISSWIQTNYSSS